MPKSGLRFARAGIGIKFAIYGHKQAQLDSATAVALIPFMLDGQNSSWDQMEPVLSFLNH